MRRVLNRETVLAAEAPARGLDRVPAHDNPYA